MIQQEQKKPIGQKERKRKKRYSYTALSLADQCPYSFCQKYILRNRPEESSLAMEAGSIAHKVKELCSRYLMAGISPDYDLLMDYLLNGYDGLDKASKEPEHLDGMLALKDKYFDQWVEPDTKSGLSYEQKIKIFREHLPDEERDPQWRTIAVEQEFEVEFDDILLFGLIDNIAENNRGQLRIRDYKTSKKVYRDQDIKTPLQMFIYHLAVQKLYPDREIVGHEYDFIFINQKQNEQNGVCSNGWLKRGETKLRKIIASVKESEQSNVWKPSPSPLCYWCSYCKQNPQANSTFQEHCPYYSLWTPESKSYEVAQKWEDGTTVNDVLAAVEKKKKDKFWF